MLTSLQHEMKETAQSAARTCIDEIPYRALVYARKNGHVPLFWLANVTGGPWNAENALRHAHQAHGGSCFFCKKPVSQGDLSVDHAESKMRGGTGNVQNLLIAHKGCNQKKGDKPIESFDPEAGREWLQALLIQVQDRLNRLG